MNDRPRGPAVTAAQLRQAFDQSFAEAARDEIAVLDDFLAIRLGADPHVLCLAEVANVRPVGAITRFPSPLDELLGVIGFRGAIVPVYDLRVLLGYASPEPPRWLVVASARPVAFAFDAFDGHARVPREASAVHAGLEHARRHVHEVLHVNDTVRPVVSLADVLETITASAQRAAT